MGNRLVRRMALIVVLVVSLIGCSSLPPASPIDDLRSISGRWQEKSGGRLTVHPDGTYRFRIGNRDDRGTVSVKNGRGITVHGTVWNLHEVDGMPILFTSSRSGNKREWSRVQ